MKLVHGDHGEEADSQFIGSEPIEQSNLCQWRIAVGGSVNLGLMHSVLTQALT